MNPVIIVGAGPVGPGMRTRVWLASACAACWIEKHASTSWHPKTRNFQYPHMEIARGWGFPTRSKAAQIDTPPGWKSPIRFPTQRDREDGHHRLEGFEGPGAAVSVRPSGDVRQDYIEQILLDARLRQRVGLTCASTPR